MRHAWFIRMWPLIWTRLGVRNVDFIGVTATTGNTSQGIPEGG